MIFIHKEVKKGKLSKKLNYKVSKKRVSHLKCAPVLNNFVHRKFRKVNKVLLNVDNFVSFCLKQANYKLY